MDKRKMPIVDLTSVVAIESIFKPGQVDPWSKRIAGEFADMYIYSDRTRYILPIPSKEHDPFIPDFIKILLSRENNVLLPEKYFTSEVPFVQTKYLKLNFINFINWVNVNKTNFLKWISFHAETWIKDVHNFWIGRKYYYEIEAITNLPEFNFEIQKLQILPEQLLYAFDVFLRYPFYGKLTGENAFYFAHPLRIGPILNEVKSKSSFQPQIPLSFSRTIEKTIDKMTDDEFSSFLHEARYIVKDLIPIVNIKPGEVDIDTRKEIAHKLKLKAHLKRIPKVAESIIAGIITGIALYPILGSKISPILGMAMSTTEAFWDYPIPKSLSQVKWLQWAYRYDLEDQSSL